MDRVKVRLKKKYVVRRLAVAAMAIVFICIVIALIIRLSGYQAQMSFDEMSVHSSHNAVIIRDEKVYTGVKYSRADYLVPEASEVEEGTHIMNLYKQGYSDSMNILIQQLSMQIYEAQMEQLGDVKDNTLVGYNEAIDAIRMRIANAALNESEDSINELEKQLIQKMDERRDYLKSILQPTEKLKNLYDREEQARQDMQTWQIDVECEGSGIVSFYSDGYENAINKDKLNIISAPILSNALKKKSAVAWMAENETFTYRIINPNEWYCAFLTDVKDSLRLAQDETYNVVIDGYGSYKAKALKCVISGDKVINILQINDELGELKYVRNVSVEITASFAGAKVNNTAVINDENGQFIDVMKNGNKTRTPIEVLAVSGDYAIVKSLSDEINFDSGVKYWIPKKDILKSLKD